MTETGTLQREDTGTLAVIKVVDPLGVGDVPIDDKLPLGFADAIEQWLKDEHGYDYADVVAKSAGARAEGRKKLEMLGVLDPVDFVSKPQVEVEIQVDTAPFEAEMQRAMAAMPDFPEEVVVEGEVVTIDDFGPAADDQLPGGELSELGKKVREGLSEEARRHAAHVEAAREGTQAGRYRASRQLHEEAISGPRNGYVRAADGWLRRMDVRLRQSRFSRWLRARFTPVRDDASADTGDTS